MFVILVYDVNSKRVGKTYKTCRKYLRPIQRSVFEGDLTQAKLNQLKADLRSRIEPHEDAVCIYEFESLRYSAKEQIGVMASTVNII